jgi:hypothetical protein
MEILQENPDLYVRSIPYSQLIPLVRKRLGVWNVLQSDDEIRLVIEMAYDYVDEEIREFYLPPYPTLDEFGVSYPYEEGEDSWVSLIILYASNYAIFALAVGTTDDSEQHRYLQYKWTLDRMCARAWADFFGEDEGEDPDPDGDGLPWPEELAA